MKNILVLFFLIQASSFFAQNKKSNNYGRIVYERIINFNNNPNATTFNLFFNPNFSVFYEKNEESKKTVSLKPSTNDEFDLSFDVKFNKSKYIVLTNFKENHIQSQVSLFSKGKQQVYIVEENISKVKWNIKNEYKTISTIKTQKAVGEFRGREYIVWFANEIPVKYGPWKLNGLPGLIMSVADTKNEVMFNVKSFKIPFTLSSETMSAFKFNNKYEKITLATYVKLKNKQVEEVQKLLSSKLPRGSKIKMSNNKSNNIELEYEFEKTGKE